MPILKQADLTINLDDDGFLVNIEDWNETVANALSEKEGMGQLTHDQLDVLRFMREYYKKYNFFPILRYVCKNVHQPKNCVNEEFMNPVQAWKIAGLPNPGDEVNMFKSWEPLGT
jgi:TusE/DsrC/DsvC family sulfur relay protein